MSPIMLKTGIVGFLLMGFLGASLIGCGDPNAQSPFDADVNQHAAGWLPQGHAAAARLDVASCKECHGSDLLGGIAIVSCTTCHLGGATSAHPGDWGTNLLRMHGPYVVANSSAGCKNLYCHGNVLQGVTDSGPACTACHSYP